MRRGALTAAALAGLSLASLCAVAAEPEPDLLTFSAGALPVAREGDSEALRVRETQALAAIDGNPTAFLLTQKPGDTAYRVELVYELPALTRFTRFAVPNVLETPSPSQTFVANVDISGSVRSASEGFESLARLALTRHDGPGEISAAPSRDLPVRWLRLTFSGGLDVQRDRTFYEFSEIRGFGVQEAVPTSDRFTGRWRGRGVKLELRQDGRLVTGCYDDQATLDGAVQGRMLYASGLSPDDGIRSSFVLTIDEDGALRGLRSSNGAPFQPYEGAATTDDVLPDCGLSAAPAIGCGSVVYGLNFAFDSADLGPDSNEVLDGLVAGLGARPRTPVVIEGHSSSEGTSAYNLDLSQRRAEAVVRALIERGLDADRLAAQGFGESRPVASNDDEAGRSLNRRVVIRCPEASS